MDGVGALPRHWLLRALDLETSQADAAQVRRDVLQALRDTVQEAWGADAETTEAVTRLEAFVARLRRVRPGDAGLNAALDRVVAGFPKGREAVLEELDTILQAGEALGEALIAVGEKLFRPGSRVLTFGFHELVLKLLCRYGDRMEGVTVSEGRPRGEGAQLAATLGAQTIPVRLITEAQLELFAPECDVALVGAERVLPDGSVVAPAGTAVLARLCAAHDVPFYVLAERERWVPEGDALAHFTRERRSPAEVLTPAPEGVQVTNVAYDLTPSDLITGYVTETGIIAPEQSEPLQKVA